MPSARSRNFLKARLTLNHCVVAGFSARDTSEALSKLLGRPVSGRTASRWLHETRAKARRSGLLANLGLCLAAIRGDEASFKILSSKLEFGVKGHEEQAREVMGAVRNFISTPTPLAMGEIVVACTLYQCEAGLLPRKDRSLRG